MGASHNTIRGHYINYSDVMYVGIGITIDINFLASNVPIND